MEKASINGVGGFSQIKHVLKQDILLELKQKMPMICQYNSLIIHYVQIVCMSCFLKFRLIFLI